MMISFLICDPTTWWKLAGSWLIKTVDRSSGSHFAIRCETYSGVKIYESVFPKSTRTPEEEWLKHYKIIKRYDFEVPAAHQASVLEWLESMVGVWYSVPQLALIALSIILKPLVFIFNRTILNHEKALICTELGSRFVEKFMRWIFTKSHDNIGVREMTYISGRLNKTARPWKE